MSQTISCMLLHLKVMDMDNVDNDRVTLLMMVVVTMMIVATNLKGRERAEQDRKKGGN